MSEFISRQKKQSFLFFLLGLLTLIALFQNFQYPQEITKSSVDVTSVLNSSETEIQNTRQQIVPNPQMPAVAAPRTQVVEASSALKINLKRAPAKTSFKKKSQLQKNKKSVSR